MRGKYNYFGFGKVLMSVTVFIPQVCFLSCPLGQRSVLLFSIYGLDLRSKIDLFGSSHFVEGVSSDTNQDSVPFMSKTVQKNENIWNHWNGNRCLLERVGLIKFKLISM